MASWNVEGLTDIKVIEVKSFMRRHNISVVCIQETHIKRTPYYTTEGGFLVVLSGSVEGEREQRWLPFSTVDPRLCNWFSAAFQSNCLFEAAGSQGEDRNLVGLRPP